MDKLDCFKTTTGYCKVKDDRLVLTKYYSDQMPLKYSHPLSKSIFGGFAYFVMSIGIIYLSIYKGLNIFLPITFGIFGILLLINSIKDLKYSRKCEILKNAVTGIRFEYRFPIFQNSRIYIKYIVNGLETETKILLSFSTSRDSIALAKEILKEKGYKN